MTPSLSSVLAAAFAGAVAAGSFGCDALDCGPGTIESNGTCVPSNLDPDPAQCGDGTVLGPGGTCIPEVQVICDPDTTEEQVDPETGVITCVGIGTPTMCSTDLPCPAPDAGKSTICGRLVDSQTDQPIAAAGATGAQCDLANPTTDGPCSLKLTFVDALQFAMSPSGATPLPSDPIILDDCGRYKATNITASSFGFTGIAVDDAAGTGDRYKLTGVALDDDNAKPARGFAAYATRNETDAAWTSSSGLTGNSLATRGVLATIFRHGTTPVAGVMVRRTGQVVAADDFYFDDPSPSTRNHIAPAQNSTGTDGTALMINSIAPDNHDGVGGEPAGCRWPVALAASIPNVVFMQVKVAETTGGAECP